MVIFQSIIERRIIMNEVEIINNLRTENHEFKKLEEEHKKLEDTLADIDKEKYLSAEEEIVRKKIQKQKLQFKDQMAKIVKAYK